MADSSGALQRPPSLRTVLETGSGVSAAGDWLERLAEVTYLELPVTPPGERVQRAADARRRAESVACRRRRCRRHQEHQERTLYWHWVADLYEDPDLAKQLVAALPGDIVETLASLTDMMRRPYPLVVRAPEAWWSCSNCGVNFDQEAQEQALTVTVRPEFTSLEEPITYCRRCVSTLVDGWR
jgi:hypothetical protein